MTTSRWILLGVLGAAPLALYAGSVTVPTTFSNGTVADAAAVNGNFGALATAVNDNHARLSTLEGGAASTLVLGTSTGGGVPANGSAALASITLPTGKYLVHANGSLISVSANGCADATLAIQVASGSAALLRSAGANQSIDGLSGRHRSFAAQAVVQVTGASAVLNLNAWFALCGGVTASVGSSETALTAVLVK